MAFKIAELFAEVTAKDAKFLASMKNVQRSSERSIAKMKKLSSVASKVFLGLGGAAAVATKLFIKQEDAEAKVNAVISATGKAAGFSLRELKKMAGGLQKVTGVGDEVILNMQALLLTFKSIRGENFKRATAAVLDLSAVMGGDLKSSALQLAKALEDPVRGLNAMARSGISFSEAQKQTIKTMAEMGDIAGAQRIILKTVEDQVKGTAEALGNTLGGKIKLLISNLGDLGEKIGDALSPLIREVTGKINLFSNSIGELDEGTKKTISTIVLFSTKLLIVSKTLGFLLPPIAKVSLAMRGMLPIIDQNITRIQKMKKALSSLPVKNVIINPQGSMTASQATKRIKNLMVMDGAVKKLSVSSRIFNSISSNYNKITAISTKVASAFLGVLSLSNPFSLVLVALTAIVGTTIGWASVLDTLKPKLNAILGAFRKVAGITSSSGVDENNARLDRKLKQINLQKKIDQRKKIEEQNKKNKAEELAKKQAKTLDDLDKEVTKSLMTEKERRLKEIQDEYDKRKEIIDKNTKDVNKIDELLGKAFKDAEKKRLVIAKEAADKKAQLAKELADKKKRIKEEEEREKRRIEEESIRKNNILNDKLAKKRKDNLLKQFGPEKAKLIEVLGKDLGINDPNAGVKNQANFVKIKNEILKLKVPQKGGFKFTGVEQLSRNIQSKVGGGKSVQERLLDKAIQQAKIGEDGNKIADDMRNLLRDGGGFR